MTPQTETTGSRAGGRATRRLVGVVVAGVIATSLLAWSARWFWLGEVAANLGWQLGWAAALGALVLASCRRFGLAVATLLVASVHLWPELSLWLPPRESHPAPGGRELTLVSCNLLRENGDHDALRGWIARVAPDVMVCLELSEKWRAVLEGMAETYPHQLFSPPGDAWPEEIWGTAILSRLPFLEERLIPVDGKGQRPVMEVRVRHGSQPILIRGVHPNRVGMPWRVAMRAKVLRKLARLEWDEHSILAGDLNATSTSPLFGDLLASSGLLDSRQGFGRQPTYTTGRWIPGLEVAIDHVLVGSGLLVTDRRTEQVEGSDHRFVIARIAPMAPRR